MKNRGFPLAHRIFLLAILGLALIPVAALAGSIGGQITYKDRVPNLKPLQMDADPACAAKHDGPVANEMLVLGDGNTLANVFVQVRNAPAGNHRPPSEPVVIDQVGCIYVPRVVGVMVGQPVNFKNSDGIMHNVHGQPKVNKGFNIGMPPILKEKKQAFNKPEPMFKVKCDVHPWMNSYIAVMTHPYFAVTGRDGKFSIDGLPDGSYEIEAWHEKLGTQSASVTVKGSTVQNFSFKIPK